VEEYISPVQVGKLSTEKKIYKYLENNMEDGYQCIKSQPKDGED
jgi:hypothetical protein